MSLPAGIRRVPGSFRDPAGYLFERDGILYRAVHHGFAEEYDAVVASGLYDVLHRAGLLVAHEEVDPQLAPEPVHRVLRPERLPFVSHPHEWSPAQLRDAALLTLRIQQLALDHGMTLRDASAYNVQLHRGRPVFIDTLSFAPRAPDAPWVAYRQFCEQFLAPLALQTLVDVRLRRLLVADVAGVPLDLAATLLPGRTRFRPGLGTHLHAHARASRRRPAAAEESARRPRFSDRALRGLVESLEGTVERLTWEHRGTTWSQYYAEASHYSDAAMADKEAAVASYLRRLRPSTVWDLGANTGRFSRLAADGGAHVVAWDVDEGAVEAAWRAGGLATDAGGEVLPLVLDLANPTPGIGWAGSERAGLTERGPVELVLALALVHHLAIGNNVPLPQFTAFLATLGRHAVVEFVPKDDPKVEVLLATREDVFPGYHREGFEQAVATHFEILDTHPVAGSARTLYLLQAR